MNKIFALAIALVLSTNALAKQAAEDDSKRSGLKQAVRFSEGKFLTAKTHSTKKALGVSATAAASKGKGEIDSNHSFSVSRGQPQVRERQGSVKTDIDANSKQKNLRIRPTEKILSPQADWFSVYDAWSSLDYDVDGDGYYSEFTVSFDVDTSGGYEDLYAEIYLSKDGGAWEHFFTTQVFTIFGEQSDDAYHVSSELLSNYPTGSYDIAIDIYQAGFEGLVASADPIDFNQLYGLPLEDNAHETGADDTLVTFAATTLYDDYDSDGFYTAFSLEYDIDTLDSGRLVYAEIEIIDVNSGVAVSSYTDDFTLGNQTEFIDLTLQTGYVAGWYDIVIRLKDAYNYQTIAVAASEFNALRELPLEAINNDNFFDDPNASTVVVETVVVHESGGGAMGILIVVLGMLVSIRVASRK